MTNKDIEQQTQGKTEDNVNNQDHTKTTNTTELLRLRSGYCQHASRSAHSHVPGDTLTPENKRAESIFRFYHKT
jgi:hypothetical protein